MTGATELHLEENIVVIDVSNNRVRVCFSGENVTVMIIDKDGGSILQNPLSQTDIACVLEGFGMKFGEPWSDDEQNVQ